MNRRVMGALSGLELGTFVLLMSNLATVGHRSFARVVGPLHGLAYLATVIAAILVCEGRHRIWCARCYPASGAYWRCEYDDGARAAPNLPRTDRKPLCDIRFRYARRRTDEAGRDYPSPSLAAFSSSVSAGSMRSAIKSMSLATSGVVTKPKSR